MASPICSIVVVADRHNSTRRAHPLRRLGRSLLHQSIQNFEIIVVYDADFQCRLTIPEYGVLAAVNALYNMLPGRVRTLCLKGEERNLPYEEKFSRGVAIASSTKVIEAAEYDVCHPFRLELQLDAMRENPTACIRLAAPIFHDEVSLLSQVSHFTAYTRTRGFDTRHGAAGPLEIIRFPLIIRCLYFYGYTNTKMPADLRIKRFGGSERLPLSLENQTRILQILGKVKPKRRNFQSIRDDSTEHHRDWTRFWGDANASIAEFLDVWLKVLGNSARESSVPFKPGGRPPKKNEPHPDPSPFQEKRSG